METYRENSKITVNNLELVLRPSDGKDIGFVYELMRHHLENLFNQIPEKWSRYKFRHGYKTERITIIEHEDMPIGFFDLEISNDQAYAHNLHISSDYRGRFIGPYILRYMESEAKKLGVSSIKGKVFRSNQKFINFLLKNLEYKIESELDEEKSVLIKKNLEIQNG